MTTRLQLFFLLVFIPYLSYSQQSEMDSVLQYWFPITIEETEEIVNDKSILYDKEWDFKTGFSYSINKSEKDIFNELPYGQYIQAKINTPFVNLGLKYHTNLNAGLVDNGKNKCIVIVNEKGDRIKVDELRQGKKILEFNNEYQGYLLNKSKNKQSIVYKNKNLIGYYDLRKKTNRYYYGNAWFRFKKTKIGRILIVKPKYFFKRIFRWNKKNNYVNATKDYHPNYNGYVALNQPKFSHYDTLKVKGYFTNMRNGKPYNKLLGITIGKTKKYGQLDTIKKTIISPDVPGRFLLNFEISDSFKLDQDYKIIFEFKGGKKKERWVKDFHVEDYELDDVEYEFKTIKNSYGKDEKVILKADAKYTTGKRVPNAQVKIKLLSSRLNEFLVDSLLIPDTLWTHTHELNFTDETQIIIPDSILPKARMEIKAIAGFSTLDGEIQQETTSFFINENSGIESERELFLSYESGYLIGEYKVKDSIVETEAILKQMTDRGDFYEQVQLPFKIKYNPFVKIVSLQKDDISKQISSHGFGDNGIDVSGDKINDSIFIEINNKYEVPIHYALLYGKNIIEEGIVNDSHWEYKSQSRGIENYYISYSYIWAGETKVEDKRFYLNTNQLEIKIEQVSEAEPGDEIDVKIKVKDYKGNPIQDVELIAAALSSKFKSDFSKAYQTPLIRGEKMKKPKWKKKFSLNENYKAKNPNVNKSINEKWFKQLNLKSSKDYRFRYPENGLHMEYVPLPKEKNSFAQFIPLVVNNGQYRKPYSVHYNRRPIYYHDVDVADYVFVGKNGKQDIIVRLDDVSIRLKGIVLKKGYKLIFSVEEDSVRNRAIPFVFSNIKPNKWSAKELSERQNSLMFIRREDRGEMYIWNNSKRVFRIDHQTKKESKFLVGPFKDYHYLNYIQQKEFQKTFKFEPGFEYDIEEKRERLYHYSFLEKDKDKKLYDRGFLPDINAFALTEKEVGFTSGIDFVKFDEPFARLYRNRLLDHDSKTKLHIDYKGNVPLVLVAINTETKDNYIFNPWTARIENLPEGEYEILYIFKYGYISKYIEIKNNHQSYLRINNEEGHLETDDFKKKVEGALGTDFDWEDSIFEEGEDVLIGMEEILNNKDFSESVAKAEKRAEIQKTIYDGPTKMVSGVVMDGNGEPLIGANIVVDAYEKMGTVTEFDGSFSIMVPTNSANLKVTYIGYGDALVNVDNTELLSINLEEEVLLHNVVVTALSTKRKSKSKGYAVQVVGGESLENLPIGDIELLLQGKSTGLQVIGANGEPGSSGFIRIRGTGSINGRNEPLYIINGTPVSAEVAAAMNPEDISNVSILKDASATAIYGETASSGVILITTTDGAIIPTEVEANNILEGFQIRENFSDYAYWRPRLVTDKNGEAYFTAKLPDDITGWQTYVLGLDQKNRAGVAFHNTVSYKKLMAELSVPRFAIEGDTFNIVGQSVNYTQDSFEVNTTFKLEDKIIQSQSSTIVNSLAEQTEIIAPSNKDSLHFQYELNTGKYGDGEKRDLPIFKKGIIENVGEFKVLNNDETFNFQAAYDSPIKISIQDNKIDVLLESIDYLKKYRYGCAEQTSSKLIALLLEKDLNRKLGKEFKDDKKINENIIRLKSMQNDEGSWGWWKGNNGIPWITLYVIEALQMANKAGFETVALEDGLDFIAQRNHLEKPAHQLKAMELLLADGTNIDSLEVMKYDTMELNISDYLLHTKVKQQLGYKIDLDSIERLLVPTTYGAKYVSNRSHYWYYDKMNHTILAYDIFKAAEKEEITESIELYFYSKKKYRRWGNTIHTAQILQRLLPNTKVSSMDSKIFVDGKEINNFPYLAKSNKGFVEIKQEGIAPYFVGLSQEIHVPNPKEKKNVFEVKTSFEQNNERTNFLEKSIPTKLRVEVNAKQEGDYIMLEIPIPAGCSYGTKTQKPWGIESHREYHKHKVIIFCTKLPKGKNVFVINLEPRYTGKYTLNPVKVEEMYAPSIFGRNEGRKLEIRN